MTTLQNLIREAFIDPIRSVLIVDDQYPTWDEVLNNALPESTQDREREARSSEKSWQDDPAGALSVISQFRKKKPALILDIHDAPDATADHLHQSDLLILDYNLEGAESGLGGAMARDILRAVLRNQHFNLVVVHTQESVLQDVFHSCLISLSKSLSEEFNTELALIAGLEEQLDELNAEEKFNPKDLSEYFDTGTYLRLRHPTVNCGDELRRYMSGEGILSRLHSWAESIGLKGRNKKAFAFWAIARFEKALEDHFTAEAFEGLTWTQKDDRLWLRTGRGFVTFVEKNHQDLLAELESALEAWQPSPSRLLSAKIRHEISCNGVEAEDRTLSKAQVFAYFYDLIRNAGAAEGRAALVRDHLNRQAEALGTLIEPAIVTFGELIHATDIATGDTFAGHYGVDLAESEALRSAATHFNSYISTLPVITGNGHLDCGHIFKLNSEWWVCATPACDMEPGQNTVAFVGSSKELRPFTALKLNVFEVSTLEESDINSGLYCFAETSPKEITCLGLPVQGSSEKVTWRTFVAKNDGVLSGTKFDLIKPQLADGSLELVDAKATVHAKLRYEYALNFIQKVGTSVTRIGLGYRGSAFTNRADISDTNA